MASSASALCTVAFSSPSGAFVARRNSYTGCSLNQTGLSTREEVSKRQWRNQGWLSKKESRIVREAKRSDRTVRAMAGTVEEGRLQKGWSYSEYGGVEKLVFGGVPLPSLGPNQVLIQVAAAGLNPVDFKRRLGKFASTDSPLPTVPGYDVAGVVAAVGEAVSAFSVGDEVYSDISEAALNNPKQIGSLAQFTATEEHLVALKPSNLSFLEAASLPLALLTAQEAFERAELKEGQSVLILNGAGGVGSLAIQLAKKVFGAARVDATASPSKEALLKGLGADHVIDYKTLPDLVENPPFTYDVVLDAIGDGERAVKLVREGGAVAILTGAAPPPSFRFVVTSSGERLAKLKPFLESGAIAPLLAPSSIFAFSDAVDAFKLLESGHVTGKVVVGPIS